MKKKFILVGISLTLLMGVGFFWWWNQTNQSIVKHYGLDNLSVREVVEKIETLNDEKALMASVKADQLVLSTDKDEVVYPIENQFYLSVAPYKEYTHECFNHSLTTCQGEMIQTWFDVNIVGDDGTVYYDGALKTGDNGFFSIWLPANVSGTIRVMQDDYGVEAAFSTASDQPTCITTMKLIENFQ